MGKEVSEDYLEGLVLDGWLKFTLALTDEGDGRNLIPSVVVNQYAQIYSAEKVNLNASMHHNFVSIRINKGVHNLIFVAVKFMPIPGVHSLRELEAGVSCKIRPVAALFKVGVCKDSCR